MNEIKAKNNYESEQKFHTKTMKNVDGKTNMAGEIQDEQFQRVSQIKN